MKLRIAFLILFAATSTSRVYSQTQPKVLTELFSSFGCSNCPTPDSNYYYFVSQNPSDGIVVINYHNGIADEQDFFYEQSKADVDAIDGSSHYNLAANPAAFIDGYSGGASWQLWESTTTKDLNPPLDLLTPKAVVESDGLIHIVFSATATKSAKVHVALKESNIYFANTFGTSGYGNPPDSIWNDIFRAMLPNSTDDSPLSAGETRSFDVVFDPSVFLFGDKWVTDNMQAVVFVQDVADIIINGTHNYNVESIGVVSLKNPSGVSQIQSTTASSLHIIGTPTNSRLVLELTASAQVKIILSDMLGREVHIAADARMPEGQTSIQMAGGILPAGCYIARMIVDGNEVDHEKLIIQ